ncbi:MAG: SUMF1/EgtB/PvdO family nonheme iron enzyme [Deltaproteobacteria bacterium]|nr:SUMF1/EgtB/PvdO family nonheme iron enzyme [Deltaproteobacteria bacterium]
MGWRSRRPGLAWHAVIAGALAGCSGWNRDAGSIHTYECGGPGDGSCGSGCECVAAPPVADPEYAFVCRCAPIAKDDGGGGDAAPEACSDECPTAGAVECTDGIHLRTCGDAGGDGCREWGDAEACPANHACQTGRCVADMVTVPAGAFWRGCNEAVEGPNACGEDEYPFHKATLPAFDIDRIEVTAAAYGACVTAGNCAAPACTAGAAVAAGAPVACVRWEDAGAYCGWAGGGRRLCTEAEWEKAARGTEGWRFPWGNECPASWGGKCAGPEWTEATARANCGETRCHDGHAEAAPAGSFPAGASPHGVLDMAGNVLEWVQDWYAGDYYCHGPDATCTASCADCKGASAFANPWESPQGPFAGAGQSGSRRVLRGGSFHYLTSDLRASDRGDSDPAASSGAVGFRCCRSK